MSDIDTDSDDVLQTPTSNDQDTNRRNNEHNGRRRHNDDDNGQGNGQPPTQQIRSSLQPFDSQLSNHIIFRSPNFSEVSLSILKSDNAIENRLNFKYMDLQILRLITSSQAGANVYSRKRIQTSSNSMKFSRLILCRVHSQRYPEDNHQLVYVMEARNQNSNMWSKNVNHRDNGAISIGSFIRFPCPLPITTFMRGDIPMMKSHMPCILLKTPSRIRTIAINEEIEANSSQALVYNGTHLAVNYSAPVKTSCSGNFCDRQRVMDWLGSKGCGCYGMSPNSTSLVIQHALSATTILDGTLKMDDFSSLKFSQLYMKGDIPGSCKLYMLQVTEAAMNLFDALENCIQLINNNGGFTVIGWYKKGLINDKGLIAPRNNNATAGTAGQQQSGGNYNNNNDEAAQVDSGELSYHIVNILPTNRDFLHRHSQLGRELNDLKYNATHIETAGGALV
jgi:hypothetical protein